MKILRQLFTWNTDGRKESLLFVILFVPLAVSGLYPDCFVFWPAAAVIGLIGGTEFLWLVSYEEDQGFIIPYVKVSLLALAGSSFIAAPWSGAPGTYLLESIQVGLVGFWFLAAGMIAGIITTVFFVLRDNGELESQQASR